ncbi:MAG: AAA family ATPase [Clostridiales bacterium]|jgi:hypothetical protein|nr:AAA family ATPase [Clostridiales bacterium]
MDKTQEGYFQALSASAESSASALESFRLSGVKNSVVEKYSDKAHFIYELLQNADDAKATSARFVLRNDSLIFAHNGTRRFTVSNPETEREDQKHGKLGDINSITSVGASSKSDEATIGKFGVGFKAVFQYTSTPHIYDPEIFFKIERLLVPMRIYEDHPGRAADETLFVFPFNHPQRTAMDSFDDISAKLRSLDYPILFLSNIKSVTFDIEEIYGSYEKNTVDWKVYGSTRGELIELTQSFHEKSSVDLLWLFTRPDKNGRKHSVGFFVDEESHLVPKKHCAFCFFPTKEVTGLSFIIHAPFLLTDSREGIRAGVKHNIDMVESLASLAADSLVYFKEMGEEIDARIIDDNIFSIVPYDEKSFTSVYSKNSISFMPFYTLMKNAFETREIIPTASGYTSSSHAYWTSLSIAKLVSTEQLRNMSKDPEAEWVFTTIGATVRRMRELSDYVKAITSMRIEDNDLIAGRTENPDFSGITPTFIESQPVDWLHAFYKWLSESKSRTDLILTRKIFLNSGGGAAAAYDSAKHSILFLPTESTDATRTYETVHRSLLDNQETYTFLINQVGLSEPSMIDEINKIIGERYKVGDYSTIKTDFRLFFRYWQKSSRLEVRKLIDELRLYEFILGHEWPESKDLQGKPTLFYFPSEQLFKWFQPKSPIHFLNLDFYLELEGAEKKDELISFLKDLGVRETPKSLEYKPDSSEVSHLLHLVPPKHQMKAEWTEHSLDGLKELVAYVAKDKDQDLSLMIWKQLLKLVESGLAKDADVSYLLGTCVYGQRSSMSFSYESSDALWLKSYPWLMNAYEEFLPVSQLSPQTLHEQYNGLEAVASELCEILGIKAKDINKEAPTVTKLGETLGLSEEEQKKALLDFAKKKKNAENKAAKELEEKEKELEEKELEEPEIEELLPEEAILEEPAGVGAQEAAAEIEALFPQAPPSIKRVATDIALRASQKPKPKARYVEPPIDEDEYFKKPVDLGIVIERAKEKATQEVQHIAVLEELKQKSGESVAYSYGWFMALLELESLANDAQGPEITFGKAEVAPGSSNSLVLKHPSNHIPQMLEDLSDIPLELHFANSPTIKTTVEAASVKSNALVARLSSKANLDGLQPSRVTEATIYHKGQAFFLDELKQAFSALGKSNGYGDGFDMQENLPKNIEFVFGPPGTGKTTYLAKNTLPSLMAKLDDLKVLVLTPTSKSADVLTRIVLESDPSSKSWLIRLGASGDELVEKSGVLKDRSFDIREKQSYTLVTTAARFPYDCFNPDGSTKVYLNDIAWDYIVFDEASMIPVASIVYPLFKQSPKKFIISGDPLQIGPVASVDIWKDANIYTMVNLDSFSEPSTYPNIYPIELLSTQYRSIPAIGEIFSNFAYGGIASHSRANDPISLPTGALAIKPLTLIKFPVTSFESIYRAKRLAGKTPYHVYSALFAVELTKYLSQCFKSADRSFSVGIIAPYRAQADLVNKFSASLSWPDNVSVQAGTIHSFQGDECDIVIALFNPPPVITQSGDMFLNKLNVVNLAISRAKDCLIVLMPDDNTESVGSLTLIKQLENLIKDDKSSAEYLSSDVEEIIFGSKTYLEEKGSAVQTREEI